MKIIIVKSRSNTIINTIINYFLAWNNAVVGLYIGSNVYARLMMLDVKSDDNPTEEEKAE